MRKFKVIIEFELEDVLKMHDSWPKIYIEEALESADVKVISVEMINKNPRTQNDY